MKEFSQDRLNQNDLQRERLLKNKPAYNIKYSV
jgi:hypothetical protein